MFVHRAREIHQPHSFGSPACLKYRYASMTFSMKLSVKYCKYFYMPIVAFCLQMYINFPFACMATFSLVFSTFIIIFENNYKYALLQCILGIFSKSIECIKQKTYAKLSFHISIRIQKRNLEWARVLLADCGGHVDLAASVKYFTRCNLDNLDTLTYAVTIL